MEITCDLTVPWEYGVHIRPATKIVKLLKKFNSDVYFSINNGKHNAKRVMELLTMEAYCGETITIDVIGDDAEEAVRELAVLFKKRDASEEDEDEEGSQLGAY